MRRPSGWRQNQRFQRTCCAEKINRSAPEDRRRLAIAADEPVRSDVCNCSAAINYYSEADNWYVPGRLTPEMNRLLDQTDTPFGRACQDLEFQRQTLKATALWRPLPKDGSLKRRSRRDGQPAGTRPFAGASRHSLHKARVPFSIVVETYTRHMFDFPLNAAK